MGTAGSSLSHAAKSIPGPQAASRCWPQRVIPSLAGLLVVTATMAPPAAVPAQDAAAQDTARPMAHCGMQPLPSREHEPRGGRFDAFQVGVDRGGTVYLSARNEPTYAWNGTRFEAVMVPAGDDGKELRPLPGGHLIGGFDRGLYVVQEVKAQGRRALYRLEGGRASFVAEGDVPPAYMMPPFLVSRSGLIVHWSYKGLTVFAGGRWHSQAVELDYVGVTFLDDGETLSVFYNDRLCRIAKDGRITVSDLPTGIPPEERNQWRLGVLWGNRLLFLDGNDYRLTTRLRAYDLASGKPVDTSEIAEALRGRAVTDAFAGPDGFVWLWTKDRDGCGLFVLTPEGDTFDVERTRALDWGRVESPYQERVLLPVAEAGFWIAQPHGGLAVLDHGQVRQFGWRDGIGVCSSIAAGPDGAVYAVDQASVHAFRRTKPLPAPGWTTVWDEHVTSPVRPVRDSAGNVRISLVEDLETMLSWDGTQWGRLKLPFSMGEAQVAVADDTGHVVIQMLRPEDDCLSYDVAPTGATEYDTLQAALEAAVERAATRFDRDAYLDDDGVIWVHQAAVGWLYRFDHGERQIMVTDNGRIRGVMKSAEHGIVAQDDRYEFYAYQDGDLHKIAPKPERGSRWLLGRNGLQPFEAELYEAAPDEYVVLDYAEDGKYYLAVSKRQDGAAAFERGDWVPLAEEMALTPSLFGGHWGRGGWGNPGVRFFGGRAIWLAHENSPLDSVSIVDVLEDKAHNLWIDAGIYGGYDGKTRHVFVKRVAGFHVETDALPTRAGRSVRVTARVVHGAEPQTGWRLFCRLNNGEWQGGEPTPDLTVAFPKDGTYEVELIGMGPLGETTPESVKFTVESKAQ